jgi:fatty acid synthase
MYYHSRQNLLHSGGIEVRGLQASVIARRKPTSVPVLEAHQLVAYRPSVPLSAASALRVCTHLVLENIISNKPKVIEWVSQIEADPTILLGPKLPAIFGDLPLINVSFEILTKI